MKILHLLSTARWSGAAEPAFLLCRELSRRGHEVRIAFSYPFQGRRISSRNLRRFRPRLWAEQTPLQHESLMRDKAAEMGLERMAEFRLNVYANVRDNLNDFQLLRRLIRQGAYDVLHCHLQHAHVLAVLARVGLGDNCRLVYSHHGGKPVGGNLWTRWLIGHRTDHVVTFCPEVAESYQTRLGLSNRRVSLLKGGIDLSLFESPPDGHSLRKRWNAPEGCLIVGMVGRMQKKRDQATLLRAVAQLGAGPHRLRCLLIGRGEDRDQLEALCGELGILDRVRFAGYLEDDYLDGLAAMDVFAYTAPGSDASCRALIEAMAMGKPVLAARRAAAPLLIEPGKTGFLFEPGDAAGLADHIQRFLDNPAMARDFGKQGRVKAFREFSCARVAEEVEKIYERLLDPPARLN